MPAQFKKSLLAAVVLMLTTLLFTIPVSAQNRQHVVRPGETLATIAAFYGTTWQQIAAVNGIVNPNLIYAGYPLIIPPAQPATINYTVQYGDNLTLIAQRYNTTVDAIATQNNIAVWEYLHAGQVLKIPVVAAPLPVPPRPAPTASRYYVQYGDTMFRIAGYFGVNVYDLAEVNGVLNLNRIYVGQSLVIPAR
ncbi:MAG: LysM peptidoglycan-binding domain-containing protein [Anaerolineae bacterium]|nr:LysM peptidoglycan-binding domain-containing protein [Anaerolineae bacterium]